MNKKIWYIAVVGIMIVLLFLIEMITGIFDLKKESVTRISVIVGRKNEQTYSEMIDGIRDYARENEILIEYIYASDLGSKDIEQLLEEEQKLGSQGVFLIYPEDYYTEQDAGSPDVDIPGVILSDQTWHSFDSFCRAAYHDSHTEKSGKALTEKDALKLMNGESDILYADNQYQMGYLCIQTIDLGGKDGFFRGSAGDQAKEIKIGIAVYNLQDPYIDAMTEELEKELNQLFDDEDREVIFRYEIMDAKGDESRQSEQLNYLLGQDADILLLNLVNPSSAADVLNQAHNKKIPVLLFNREVSAQDLDISRDIWYVGSDGQKEGNLQGRMLISAWKKNRKQIDKNKNGMIEYILVEGEEGNYDSVRRTNAFMESTAETLPMNLLADFSADWSREQAYQKLKNQTDLNVSETEVVICNNDDMALGVYDYFSERDMKMPLILGINDMEEVHELIRQGKLYGTVNLNRDDQVKDIVHIVDCVCSGKAVEQKIWYSVPSIYVK